MQSKEIERFLLLHIVQDNVITAGIGKSSTRSSRTVCSHDVTFSTETPTTFLRVTLLLREKEREREREVQRKETMKYHFSGYYNGN